MLLTAPVLVMSCFWQLLKFIPSVFFFLRNAGAQRKSNLVACVFSTIKVVWTLQCAASKVPPIPFRFVD